jgi:hypothetical protein
MRQFRGAKPYAGAVWAGFRRPGGKGPDYFRRPPARWSTGRLYSSRPPAALNSADESVQDLFLAGLVKIDGQLVAVDGGDVAVAELLMKNAVADGEG